MTNTDDPKAVQNAAGIRKVRRQMLKGLWPKACIRCKTVEKCGGKSRRQIENWRFQESIPEILEKTDLRGYTQVSPTYVDLRLGNQCNLVCRMCNPRASRKWRNEWNKVKLKWERYPFVKSRFKYDWYRKRRFRPFLYALLPDAKFLHFAGGEPLIIPETLNLLKELQKRGKAPNIEVSFNTNLTVLSDELLNCLKEFKRVYFYVSIDAYGELNNYIRYPSQWDKIVSRLCQISKWAEHSPFFIQFNVTVQMYNILKLDKLIDWIQSLDLTGVGLAPNLTVLNNPSYFDIRNLPKSLKKKVTETIEIRKVDWIRAVPNYERETLAANLESILEHLKFSPSGPWNQSHFYTVTAAMDKLRKQNLYDLLPEFSSFSARNPDDFLPLSLTGGAGSSFTPLYYGPDNPDILIDPHTRPLGLPKNSAYKA